MRMLRKLPVTLFFLIAFFLVEGAYATKTRVSVLTTSPSDIEVYTLWGHTALRVRTDTSDVVYNYGVFMFDDGFLYRFVKGKTDYWLDTQSMYSLRLEVLYKKAALYEQTLNLTEPEAESLHRALLENAKAENRVYRYNFFYDNCATRVWNIVERQLGDLKFPHIGNRTTYREKIYSLTEGNLWLRFGIDLCLGSQTDQPIPDRGLIFLPEDMRSVLSQTQRSVGGRDIPLVKKERELVPFSGKYATQVETQAVRPVVGSVLLLVLVAVLTWAQVRHRESKTLLVVGSVADTFLFVVYGLTGVLLAFLTFVSVHPCTSPNFNLLWSNPLQLLFPLFAFAKKTRKPFSVMMWLNLAACVVALLGWLCLPQKFNVATYPLVAAMALRTIVWLRQNGFCQFLEIKKSEN